MALVSKSKAAKLAGVSRTTIHRYVSEGKLSMSGDQLDTSELLRVFGTIGGQVDSTVDVPTGQPVTGGGQGGGQAIIDLLEAQLRDIRQDRDHWREKSDQLAELLKAEQDNIKLLTHQDKPSKDNPLLTVAAIGLVLACLGIIGWSLYQVTL